MQTFREFEQSQIQAQSELQRKKYDCIKCPTCSSEFFEQLKIARYSIHSETAPGQKLPPGATGEEFVLLRCARCSEALEPRVLRNSASPLDQEYNFMLRTMMGEGDTREGETYAAPADQKGPDTNVDADLAKQVAASIGGSGALQTQR